MKLETTTFGDKAFFVFQDAMVACAEVRLIERNHNSNYVALTLCDGTARSYYSPTTTRDEQAVVASIVSDAPVAVPAPRSPYAK